MRYHTDFKKAYKYQTSHSYIYGNNLVLPTHNGGTMAKIEMYTTVWCPYCVRAKALLKELNQTFSEFNIETEPEKGDEMAQRAPGFTSVPQIFINDMHIGGCDELYSLHQRGELEKILND